jgi:hypothetical protein
VTPRTVHRLEIDGELHIAKKLCHGHVSGNIWAKIVAALKRHGVKLLPETDEPAPACGGFSHVHSDRGIGNAPVGEMLARHPARNSKAEMLPAPAPVTPTRHPCSGVSGSCPIGLRVGARCVTSIAEPTAG